MQREAKARMLAFLADATYWPPHEHGLFHGSSKLGFKDRMRLSTFLVGNGCAADDIYEGFRTRLGNAGNHEHLKRVVREALSDRHDHEWYYFDLERQDFAFLGGEACLHRRPPQPLVRVFNAWEAEVDRVRREQRRYPTLAEQRAFLG